MEIKIRFGGPRIIEALSKRFEVDLSDPPTRKKFMGTKRGDKSNAFFAGSAVRPAVKTMEELVASVYEQYGVKLELADFMDYQFEAEGK